MLPVWLAAVQAPVQIETAECSGTCPERRPPSLGSGLQVTQGLLQCMML